MKKQQITPEEKRAFLGKEKMTTADLLKFLPLYGKTQKDVVVAFSNYYQDISGGQSFLGQLSKVDGVRFFNPNGEMLVDVANWEFEWWIDGELVSTNPNPRLVDLRPSVCDGVVSITHRITEKATGATFERVEWAYLDYNDIGNCLDCSECPSQFEVFYTFYPDVEKYHFQSQHGKYDFNTDNKYTVKDLLSLISRL